MKRGFALILAAAMLLGVAPAALAQPALPEGFSLKDTETVASVNLFNLKQQAFVDAKAALPEINRLLQNSAPKAGASPMKGPAVHAADRMEITLDNDMKYTYEFFGKGVRLSKSKPGEDAGTPAFYKMSASAVKDLSALLNKTYTEGVKGAAWLGLMRESKASGLTITSQGGRVQYDVRDGSFRQVFALLKGIEVDPASCETASGSPWEQDGVRVGLEFANGTEYTVQISNETLIVESSDMPSGLRYKRTGGAAPCTFEDFVDMDGKMNPNTGKPVIYLYPPQKTDVSVKVHYTGEFVYTYPAYNGGWNVTAYPDGRLVNQSDGTEHFYLFWDGYKPVDWKFDNGFCVSGADTEKFLREKLAYMGLTPREYNDFIVFWLPEMQQNPYNLITFSTEQYEAVAPLEISPKPDSLLRIHMVFKAVDKPVNIPAQKLEQFERKGFAAVEWGGSRA